jgi:hypothetical protein
MKVSNMVSGSGNSIPNQFIITDEGRGALGNFKLRETFQSYSATIATRITWDDCIKIKLDSKYWNYSTTTSRYRNQFLGETTKETQVKIASGEYILADLNDV